MSNVLQIALEAGSALTGVSGLIGALAIRVRTKSDMAVALAKLEQDSQKQRDDGERADRKQESEEDRARYDELNRLYQNACSDRAYALAERDRAERLARESRADAETLRAMWGIWDTTLDDVVEREKARYVKLKGHKP